MSDRDSPPIFDYLIAALNPALIMMLVGSLVFFLTDVFHQGSYETRLLFVFACYIFAMVLITRISITQGRSYAFLYIAPLAFLTSVALWQFVSYSGVLAVFGMPFSCLLLVVIWWAVDRLTWDCTFVDNSLDPSNVGLLQAAGIVEEGVDDANDSRDQSVENDGDSANGNAEQHDNSERQDSAAAESGKLATRSRNRPGVWIVYFSLAALPLFGIGGWFVPGDDLERRRYIFLLLAAYTFSGLGLLATTSLMGIREYLLSRSVSIRPRMMVTWLAMGGVAIVGVMVIAWMLPRRTSEYSLTPVAESRDAWEWKNAPGNDGKTSEPDGSVGEPDDNQGSAADAGDSEGASQSQSDSNEQGSAGEESGSEGKGKSDDGEAGQGENDSSEPNDSQSTDEPSNETDNDRESNNDESDSSSNSPQSSSFQFPNVSAIIAFIAELLKWGFFVAMVIVLCVLGFRFRNDLWASWQRWLARLQAWWYQWFGGKGKAANLSEPVADEVAAPTFPAFANPFPQSDQRSPDELIRYTFSALEAWGRDHDCARDPDDTPFEFAGKIAVRFPSMAQPARLIAELYTASLYAGVATTSNDVARLQQPWQIMTAL